MLPTLSVLHREIAGSILLYRNLRLSGAKQKAASNGYSGLQVRATRTRFVILSSNAELVSMGIGATWSGSDAYGMPIYCVASSLYLSLSPLDLQDADTGIYEQHISSDIVLAIKQFWHLSGDLNWLNSYLDLVTGVADFWSSRATRRSDGTFGIYGVTGPDEYAVNVNNSVYTNAAAQLSLQFAVEACGLLNVSCRNSATWQEVASRMYIPFDASLGIHPEYDGYAGGTIKQADVVLLSYPLGLSMADSVRYAATAHGRLFSVGFCSCTYFSCSD
jgi:hypothetical protein